MTPLRELRAIAAPLTLAGRFRILCALRGGPYGVEAMNVRVERILARCPNSYRMRNAYAIFAGKASDWDTCNRLLLEIGDKFDMDLWATWDNVAYARMWAAGKGLPGTIVSQFR